MEKIKFKIEESEKQFINGFTGKRNSKRVIAMKGNLKGYLPNESNPYAPIGGIKVLKELIDILVWK